MKRDPFDHLREINPLPEDHPVYPPMGTAERITGGPSRRSWPAWALAGGFALVALLAGGAWLLWIRGGTHEVAATSAPPTTVAGTTAPVGEAPTDDAVIYLVVSDDGTENAPGPYLIPVARPLAVLSHFVTDPVYEAVNFLLIGSYPGEEEAGPTLFSAIPEGTQLLGLEVADGIAAVDLSSHLTTAPPSLALRHGLAQVVFTLTRFPEIDGVRFLVEGVPTTVFGSQQVTIPDPATRADFEDLLPAILIESPVYWASSGDNPLVVTGTANVFEAVVSLELLDQDGAILWEGTTLATCGTGCRGEFTVEVPYEVPDGQFGTLVAWEASARDGSRTNVRRHPVWLNATPGTTTTTSVDPIAALLADRSDLDKALDAYLEEQAAIEAQLAGLPLDQGTELRIHAAEIDQQVNEVRDGLARVFHDLQEMGADFDIPCSADELGSELEAQPGLPPAVSELRTALYEAARACDWQALQDLVADPTAFSYSFGESGDPIAYWQRMEFLHYQPMLYIAGMLERPYGAFEGPDGPVIYAWPSAYTYRSWAEVPEADRQVLLPLYDALDLSSFAEFGGYLGVRVGISADRDQAIWIYAIEGD